MFHLLTSIVFIFLIFLATYLIALKWPKISKIIFAALFVRFFVLILGFFFELPESFFDAKTFEFIAWNWSQNGFFGVFEISLDVSSFVFFSMFIPCLALPNLTSSNHT